MQVPPSDDDEVKRFRPERTECFQSFVIVFCLIVLLLFFFNCFVVFFLLLVERFCDETIILYRFIDLYIYIYTNSTLVHICTYAHF